MTPFDRLKSLCDKQGISINDLEEKLDIGKNSLYSWKKGIPKGTNLIKVADYFNVSTDYLLGRSDQKILDQDSELDTKLERMMDNAMSYDGKPISDDDRPIIKGILKAYFDNKK